MRVTAGRILVVGLGRSGAAAAEFLLSLARAGAPIEVHAADAADTAGLRGLASGLAERGARVVLGTDDAGGDWDLVVASPGVPPSSALLRSAAACGAQVVTEVELAFGHSEAPFVAVTGTNGKTTVTAMIAHLLNTAGIHAEPIGNIGTPAVGIAPQAPADAVMVAEVSSFQLAHIVDFHPVVSVLLNITEDHMDWHGTMERYTADKARVFENQCGSDLAVIVVDDPGAAPFAERAEAGGVRVARVSLDTLHPGGASLVDGILTLSTTDGDVGLLPAEALPVRGAHNMRNALAASLAAAEMGAEPPMIAVGLASFAPIEHRLEPAGEVGGAEYVNDSKATNPAAVATALDAFDDRPVVLLLGGDDSKGGGFGSLAGAMAGQVEAVVAFGAAAGRVESDLAGAARVVRAGGLADAVKVAAGIAHAGDAVLLSPGCASFDEFTDYRDRGETFKGLVASLSEGGDV